jgi:hypothetical protein
VYSTAPYCTFTAVASFLSRLTPRATHPHEFLLSSDVSQQSPPPHLESFKIDLQAPDSNEDGEIDFTGDIFAGGAAILSSVKLYGISPILCRPSRRRYAFKTTQSVHSAGIVAFF